MIVKINLRFSARVYFLILLIIVLTLGSASRRTVIRAATCVTNPIVINNADSGAGSLRQAIADVCDGGTITFADSVVSPITLTNSELLIDNKGLTIQGPGTRPMTISGNHATRVIERRFDSGNPVTLSNLTIADGSAGMDVLAAGVYNNGGGTLNIINCTITGNVNVGGDNGGFGGGLGSNGTMNIVNSTISGNSSTGMATGGGGIFNNLGTLNLTNCTISGNSTNTSGGGIRNNGGTVNIQNTIVAGNTASQSGPDIFHPFNSLGNNLIGKSDGGSGFTDGANGDHVGTVAMPLDPKLGPLQDNGGPTFTMALLTGSPALDAGSDSVLGTPLFLTTDQRGTGFPRKAGSHVDIGAFELQPCTLMCPADITQKNDTDQCGAVVTYPAPTTSGDISCDTVTCSPASGTFFPVGTTTVTCKSNNGAGPGMCMFTVTVQDTQNPTITCPANITTPTDPDQCSAKVTYAQPSVGDNCPQVGTPNCSPASGTTFQKGTTTVTCSVKDSSSNMSMCTFTVTVNDMQPPKITCPATISAAAGPSCPIATSRTVSFPGPVATDNCAVQSVVCNPPSGSTFPVGTTSVTCTATDTSGNTAQCTFVVTVSSFCLQDDSNPGNVVLVNASTGDFSFCCGGVQIASGRGTLTTRGCIGSIDGTKGDRQVHIQWDTAANNGNGAGTAYVQKRSNKIVCQITDKNVSNNTCQCSAAPPASPKKPPKESEF